MGGLVWNGGGVVEGWKGGVGAGRWFVGIGGDGSVGWRGRGRHVGGFEGSGWRFWGIAG